MRGDFDGQSWMLSPITPETLVPQDHPIRPIRDIVDRALTRLRPTFKAMYSHFGRPSIPPEHLLKGMLLMSFYSIRSERQLCERLRYDLLFKWFLDLNITDPAFDHSTFSKNRKRLIDQEIAQALLGEVVRETRRRRLISEEHFTVDGTLLQAWASLKSLRPRTGEGASEEGRRGRNASVDFHGERRSNGTHVSKTDPEARLARKGYNQETRLCFGNHLLMENRNGLVVDVLLTQATGRSEREAALVMLDRWPRRRRRITLGGDKGYDVREFVEDLRTRRVTPHVAQNTARRKSAIDGRTTRHEGYAMSLRRRKMVEEGFGWEKTVGGGRKLRYTGVAKNQLWATFNVITYDLVRMANIEARTA